MSPANIEQKLKAASPLIGQAVGAKVGANRLQVVRGIADGVEVRRRQRRANPPQQLGALAEISVDHPVEQARQAGLL